MLCSCLAYIPAHAQEPMTKTETQEQTKETTISESEPSDIMAEAKSSEEMISNQETKDTVTQIPEETETIPEADVTTGETQKEEDKPSLLISYDDELKTIVNYATARGAGIEYWGKVSYLGTTVGAFTVNGSTAFCMEHQKPTPDTGTDFAEEIYYNENIRKVLHYGWEGREQWGGFGSYEQGVVVTSLALSYFYSGEDSMGMLPHGSSANQIGLSQFFDFIDTQTVPSTEMQFSKNYSESHLSDDKTYQRSDDITFYANVRNTITIPLAEGMELVNLTTGVVDGGLVPVKGGDTFYIRASLSVNQPWSTGNLMGTMGKLSSVLCITGSNALQDLGYGKYAIDPDKTVNLTIKWEAAAQIQLQKIDSETGNKTPQGGGSFENAVYGVYTDANCTVPAQDIQGNTVTLTTDASGLTPASGLMPFGTVYLKEITAPSGYCLSTEVLTAVLPGTSGDPLNVVVTAKEEVIRGDFEIIKFGQTGQGEDPEIKRPLKDVEFTLTHQKTGEKVVIVTDKNGRATTIDTDKYPRGQLAYGKWQVQETKTPIGFKPIASFIIDITNQGEVKSYIAEDKRIFGAIRLVKIDQSTGKVILRKNTEFKIVNKDTGKDVVFTQYYPNIQKITTLKTDETGQCMLPEKLNYGRFQLVELKAPEGYLLNPNPVEFMVDKDYDWTEPLTVEMADENVKGTISLVKTDADTNQTLAGAEYEITAAEDIVTPDGTVRAVKGTIMETIKTKEGKVVSKPLYLGKYVVKESKAPDGFALSDKTFDVVLQYKDHNTAIVTKAIEAKDYPVKINIHKTTLGTDTILEEVTFAFWNILDEPAEDDVDPEFTQFREFYRTDKKGNIEISHVIPGDYKLQEVETLEGYVLDEHIYLIHVDEKGNITIKGDCPNLKKAESIAEEKGSPTNLLMLQLTNDFTKVEISKTDITGEKELQGAHFEIIHADTKKVVAEFVSGVKPHRINKLALGKYILHEKLPPEGYATAKDIPFEVGNDGKIVKVSMKDPSTKVSISKEESTTGKELPGAHLKLQDDKGTVIKEWISGDTPMVIENLSVGKKYLLEETIAPKGFKVAQSITFIIQDTGEVQKVVMKDEYSVGAIKPHMPTGGNSIGGIKTGDTAHTLFYLAILLCSLAGISFYVTRRNRKREEKQ